AAADQVLDRAEGQDAGGGEAAQVVVFTRGVLAAVDVRDLHRVAIEGHGERVAGATAGVFLDAAEGATPGSARVPDDVAGIDIEVNGGGIGGEVQMVVAAVAFDGAVEVDLVREDERVRGRPATQVSEAREGDDRVILGQRAGIRGRD